MDFTYLSMLPNGGSQEEVKHAVVEQALFQAFNPYGSLPKGPNTSQNSVISYSVQRGDTLSEIAYKYGLSLKELIKQNKISNPNMVGIGMKLVIKRNEITHSVHHGETLEQIAQRYSIRKEVLLERNPLVKLLPDILYVGQTLRIPVPEAKPALAGNVQVRQQMAQAASRQTTRQRAMEWPIKGATVTSGFGMRWGQMHKGLDLWNQEESKALIYAARKGVVVEAGANRGGYGYIVILDHGDGLHTYYAHMRKILVNVGQEIDHGQILGYMGRTGDSTGYHLHFEVRQDDVPMNPLRYLNR